MLRSSRGFTVIQFIVAMMMAGLILLWVFLQVAQRTWRDNQRRSDLGQVEAMLQHYAEAHQGRYPDGKAADDPGSDLQARFQTLGLTDPKGGKYYVLGSDFAPCDGGADPSHLGPGYISYGRPGINSPYKLRICLEIGGDYSIGD